METPPLHEAPSMEVKASVHHRPDAKAQRYDRQLRLWAASGQAALESAHVLVINGGATSTSILKNLVLPGVGQFTILDDAKVQNSDLGNNFFLQPGTSKVGQDYRAEQAARFLAELNDGVKAHAITQSVSEFLVSSPDALSPFSLVISVNAPPEDTLLLADRAWEADIPLIAVKSCGFIGSLRTQMQEVHFIETHPDQEATLDLRLDQPFPALLSHSNAINFDALDSHEYAHIPPIVILLQGLTKWRADHADRMPSNFKEKKEFKAMLEGMKRGGKNADHENFDEALALVMKTIKQTQIPPEVEAMFQDPNCEKLTADSAPFWILLRAVRNFVESSETNEGARLLPLHGSLPDMKATSTGYNALLQLYRAKSKEDMASIRHEVTQVLGSIGSQAAVVDDEMISVFVKNAPFAKVIQGRKMRDEYERPDSKAIRLALDNAALPNPLADPEAPQPAWGKVGPIHFYLAFRAADTFFVEHSRWPGTSSSDDGDSRDGSDSDPEAGERDLDALKECLEKVGKVCLGEDQDSPAALSSEEMEMSLHEIARAGAADLPQIAALLGGIVAQEAIKIVTKQYVPLNGTSIFDGIKSATESFNF